MKRAGLLVVLVCTVTGLSGVAGAKADGLPVLGVDVGSSGVASPAGGARYVTLPAGGQTLVAHVDPHGGQVLERRLLRRRLTIPALAYDGSADGLSHHGRTSSSHELGSHAPRPASRCCRPEGFDRSGRCGCAATSASTQSRRTDG